MRNLLDTQSPTLPLTPGSETAIKNPTITIQKDIEDSSQSLDDTIDDISQDIDSTVNPPTTGLVADKNLNVTKITEEHFTKLKELLKVNRLFGNPTLNSSRCEVYPQKSMGYPAVKPQHLVFMTHHGRPQARMISNDTARDNLCISNVDDKEEKENEEQELVQDTDEIEEDEIEDEEELVQDEDEDEDDEEIEVDNQQSIKRKKAQPSNQQTRLKKVKHSKCEEMEATDLDADSCTTINVTMHSQNVFVLSNKDHFIGIIDRLLVSQVPSKSIKI
ncbi:hypothetical protein DFA_10323 [Cavenderia fasciculata]|uniref:Uncharacterized protein n=1 Tax=Cavenderia fasciculata TaxID=261658 RepID=F4Q9W5_CACFS|nr:uncharacterized protein DFA_10323 [Cavenderia fasciculata]EGG15484.1 hypothetical protein DFA_10323 [Cavenderia fasciculata]|eukprot:XP_004354226.1 hypothetical protein DFA_10323 [Cavenderia fasciculata]